MHQIKAISCVTNTDFCNHVVGSFKLKMRQTRFRPGSAVPNHAGGAYDAPTAPALDLPRSMCSLSTSFYFHN